jgi:hypothetical protein
MAEIDVMFEKVFGDSSSGVYASRTFTDSVIIADEMKFHSGADVDVGYSYWENSKMVITSDAMQK